MSDFSAGFLVGIFWGIGLFLLFCALLDFIRGNHDGDGESQINRYD